MDFVEFLQNKSKAIRNQVSAKRRKDKDKEKKVIEGRKGLIRMVPTRRRCPNVIMAVSGKTLPGRRLKRAGVTLYKAMGY